MNDKKICLTVTNPDGDSLTQTLPWDANLSDFVTACRIVALWLTYSPATIDDYLPDSDREWSYDDEREPDDDRLPEKD